MSTTSPPTSATVDDMTTPPRPPRKAGNPDGSKWRSTPVAKRKRKPMSVNLSDAARAEVERQAVEQHDGNKSQAVEAAIWLAAPPERRPVKP